MIQQLNPIKRQSKSLNPSQIMIIQTRMKNTGVNPGYSIMKISNRREGEAGTNFQGKNRKIGNMFNTWKKSEPQTEHRT